jgi:hypothetical protein
MMTNALFIAWRSGEPTKGRWGPVGRLEHGPSGYRFLYTRGARTLEGFRPFPDMPRLDAVYESDALFPLFANRLLSRSRPEYEAYLTWGGFDPNQPPDPIAVLGVTEGMRQTDSLEVFPVPSPDAHGRYRTKFFLHGVQWGPTAALERISRLRPGERLGLMLDVLNEYDPHAVAVRTTDVRDRFMIGYVPRYLARDVGTLCASGEPESIEFAVERVNIDAPLQHRVLCRLNAGWPEGFSPCGGEEYQPIVAHFESMIPQG